MGKMNLLKANWIGKVGETVGAKWKNLKTIRTYSIPSNPKTEAQTTVRTVFKGLTGFVALFSDQIKYLSSLDTRGMSVRNAIIKANADMVSAGEFKPEDLVVNKGGLPNVTAFTAGLTTAGASFSATWTKPVATNLTSKAKLVVVAVNAESNVAVAKDVALDAETVTVDMPLISGEVTHVYYYVIDYRGSSRVGSVSGHVQGTPA